MARMQTNQERAKGYRELQAEFEAAGKTVLAEKAANRAEGFEQWAELTEFEKTCDAEAAFDKFVGSIENPKLCNRVVDSATVNAFGNRDEYPTDLARWQAALATAEMIMDDPKGFYGDDWKEF
jgi:hypothetical protein